MIFHNKSRAEGIIIDLTDVIINEAGLNASVKTMDWSKAQQKLKNGTADALLQINPNPERNRTFEFSNPLLLTEFSIFRRSDRANL